MNRAPFWMTIAALLLASGSCLLSVILYIDNREATTELRTFNVRGCERQNRLRNELNQVLSDFKISPRFPQIDCAAAYEADARLN